MARPGPPRIRVVLEMPRTPGQVLELAKGVHAALAAKPKMFPAPNPPLAVFKADIDALDGAEATALRLTTKVAYDDRDAKALKVKRDLEAEHTYVQWCADEDPQNAVAIAAAAHMTVERSRPPTASRLRANPIAGKAGSYKLITKKQQKWREAFDWQMSLDEKATFVGLPSSIQASTIVKGLTLGARVWFRTRSVTKAGPGDWCEPILVVVR
jgi:hypothetical protein